MSDQNITISIAELLEMLKKTDNKFYLYVQIVDIENDGPNGMLWIEFNSGWLMDRLDFLRRFKSVILDVIPIRNHQMVYIEKFIP